MNDFKNIEELIGQTITKLENGTDEVVIETLEGKRYRMYHAQNCCERVYVELIEGEIKNILNSPILKATENIGHDDNTKEYESITLTDYKLTTSKSSITIKWNGSSNGYYSEAVYFAEIN